MEVIPAIDLRDGNVVRLLRGEYDQQTTYSNDPAVIARKWEAEGAKTIHLVDLDGARDGEMKNRAALQAITSAVHVRTELGGGLRDMETVEFVLEKMGITRAILGSVLLEKPDLAVQAAQKYPNRIILGIDARDGLVATRGWRTTSAVRAIDVVREFAGLPIAAVIYTDIAKDGTQEGPNLEATTEIAAVSPFPVIASGGIGALEHVQALADLCRTERGKNIVGVIMGKALYEGNFGLREAIAMAE
ncbi:MAG: 1-(5-phosphoribosyl)-5-[(5-phosphoribosylamino)methylideneamino]imidazole-4-carboxamide isomerase [Candidatus Omnitrophota bacterium]|jgi:phosphoribosylformimino-5-aminoimidazole carboxamide ribotide isomerase|nr:MAG: 1-(5-phosphoribosyl)-5-[(5-phosphoribosylamino)methylideneamino]imidazole-4-carboxamide isomerase [Candidatus Omnitrophota bacterium]